MRCRKVKVRCVKFGAWPPKAISPRHSAESEAHEGRVACPRPLLTLQAVEGQGSLWVGLFVCEYRPPRGGCRVPLGGARSPQTGEVPGLPLVAEPSSFTLGAGPGRRHWVPLRQTAPTSLPASLGVGNPSSLALGTPSRSPHTGRTRPLTARPDLPCGRRNALGEIASYVPVTVSPRDEARPGFRNMQ